MKTFISFKSHGVFNINVNKNKNETSYKRRRDREFVYEIFCFFKIL